MVIRKWKIKDEPRAAPDDPIVQLTFESGFGIVVGMLLIALLNLRRVGRNDEPEECMKIRGGCLLENRGNLQYFFYRIINRRQHQKPLHRKGKEIYSDGLGRHN